MVEGHEPYDNLHRHLLLCPTCGASLTFASASMPDFTAMPVGAFADPTFPPPRFSVYEARTHPWTSVSGADVEHWD